MKALSLIIITLFLLNVGYSQPSRVNRQQFFLDDRIIETTLNTDLKKLRNNKGTPVWQQADISMQFDDTSLIHEQIRVRARGVSRKATCDLASLMLDFKNISSPKLSPLKNLKLVSGCHSGGNFGDLLLKEFLVYKIYNFISVMSFRVRLLHITFQDNKERTKKRSEYAFLIEDINDLADRNNCIEIKNKKYNTEATNRQQINLVCLFQYMIGNTDWAVPVNHNMKLIVSKNDTLAMPYPVPYDFDYAGLVNAGYAVPDEQLEIKSVTDRVYRGFGRNMNELQINLNIFKEKKEQIMFYLKNFNLLSANQKKEMIGYLEEFYRIINSIFTSIYFHNPYSSIYRPGL